jgi:signal peptidase
LTHTTVYRTRPHSKISLIAFLLLALVGLIGLVLWRAPSVQVMTVESSSMAPNIHKGDAVVLRPANPTELRVGDVVSYRSPVDQGVIITHRIIELQTNWQQVVTKGDNVARNDRPLPMDQIIGRVNIRVAYLGFALNFLRSPAGLALVVYLPALVIVVLELKRLILQYTKPTYRLSTYSYK